MYRRVYLPNGMENRRILLEVLGLVKQASSFWGSWYVICGEVLRHCRVYPWEWEIYTAVSALSARGHPSIHMLPTIHKHGAVAFQL